MSVHETTLWWEQIPTSLRAGAKNFLFFILQFHFESHLGETRIQESWFGGTAFIMPIYVNAESYSCFIHDLEFPLVLSFLLKVHLCEIVKSILKNKIKKHFCGFSNTGMFLSVKWVFGQNYLVEFYAKRHNACSNMNSFILSIYTRHS